MPFNVVFYQEEDGTVPALEWLDTLAPKVQDKFFVRIERLKEIGHAMRRPEADYLRDGIYELRVRFQRTQYRILYFFHGRTTIVLCHGLVKTRRVPPREIEKALERKGEFELDPEKRTAGDQT